METKEKNLPKAPPEVVKEYDELQQRPWPLVVRQRSDSCV